MLKFTDREETWKRVVERRQQNVRHSATLMKLTRMDNSALDPTLREITEGDTAAIDVSRLSGWLLNGDGPETIDPVSLRESRRKIRRLTLDSRLPSVKPSRNNEHREIENA